MSIALSNNEKIIKEYAYASTHEGLINQRTTQNSLTVTNKRIIKTDICEKKGYEKISVSEISVDAVTGLTAKTSSSFKFKFLVFGIILGFFGLFLLMGPLNEGDTTTTMILLSLPLLAGAAFCIYKFINTRHNVLVCTFIVSERINSAMNLGAFSFNSFLPNFSAAGKSAFVKVVVDGSVAKNFVNEIGALIVNIKESKEA